MKITTARLKEIIKEEIEANAKLPQYNDERIDDGGPYDPAAEEAGY